MKELIEIIANDIMVPTIAFCGGAFIALICYILHSTFTEFRKNGTPATGEVISFVEKINRSNGKNNYLYFPMLRFTNAEGEVIVQKNTIGYSNKSFKKIPYTKKIHYVKNESGYEVNIVNKPAEYLLIAGTVIAVILALCPICIYFLNNYFPIN